MAIFRNRIEAGERLAAELAGRGYDDVVVFGLPRGGVPVAAAVASRLKAPLDVILVRKIGAPGQPELAVGAVVDGSHPEIVRNDDLIRATGISETDFQAEVQRQMQVIETRRNAWVARRPAVAVTGKTAIVVDDGVATGATFRASLHALKRRGPKRIVAAAPVASTEALRVLKTEADEVVCLAVPEYFPAISVFYDDFRQVPDDDVSRLLELSAPSAPG